MLRELDSIFDARRCLLSVEVRQFRFSFEDAQDDRRMFRHALLAEETRAARATAPSLPFQATNARIARYR
jgi:hypothetical protein